MLPFRHRLSGGDNEMSRDDRDTDEFGWVCARCGRSVGYKSDKCICGVTERKYGGKPDGFAIPSKNSFLTFVTKPRAFLDILLFVSAAYVIYAVAIIGLLLRFSGSNLAFNSMPPEDFSIILITTYPLWILSSIGIYFLAKYIHRCKESPAKTESAAIAGIVVFTVGCSVIALLWTFLAVGLLATD